MEPAEATLAIRFVARVTNVEEKKYKQWIKGIGKDAEFAEISLGWFIALEGSYEALFIGWHQPRIRIGDIAKVTLEFPR